MTATAPRSAFVVIHHAGQAAEIARAVTAVGWQVCGMANSMRDAQRLMAAAPELPDVVIVGIYFSDGDGLQFIRSLSVRNRPSAVFIASHQQRAVIKAAMALTSVCGLTLAGVAEQPVEAHAIAEALRGYQPVRTALRLRPVLGPLSHADLSSLMHRHALVPWMQPKVRVDTREVVGFEALMRSHDEAGALITPDRLIPALAQHGLLTEATLHMAQQTVAFVAHCLSEGMAISASVNVPMLALADFHFCRELAQVVAHAEVDPSWITVEITETDAMSELAQVIENTARIRMLGFNLAIDDFGTAYSSFFQLSQIPFSELKIERAFIQGLQGEATHQAIVRACAQLGHSLGMHVVAEGVETAEELHSVRRCGCSQVQGYLVARPMPVATALSWISGLDGQCVPLPRDAAAGLPRRRVTDV